LAAAIVSIVPAGVERDGDRIIGGVSDAQREIHVAVVVSVIQAARVERVITRDTDLIPVPRNAEGGWKTGVIYAESGQIFLARLVVGARGVVDAGQRRLGYARCQGLAAVNGWHTQRKK
jgi:hypothetical protein